MATAFVIISAGPTSSRRVYEELSNIKEIVELHPLLGECDLIAKVVSEDHASMGRVVLDKIRPVGGVIGTKMLTGITS